nr:hypothetical protein [Brachyspira hyodysenteriae]
MIDNIFDFLLNQNENTKFILGIVFIVIFYIIFMYIKKRSKKWYSQNKIIVDGKDFFMLKDKVNNIYILIAIDIKIMLMPNGLMTTNLKWRIYYH